MASNDGGNFDWISLLLFYELSLCMRQSINKTTENVIAYRKSDYFELFMHELTDPHDVHFVSAAILE